MADRDNKPEAGRARTQDEASHNSLSLIEKNIVHRRAHMFELGDSLDDKENIIDEDGKSEEHYSKPGSRQQSPQKTVRQLSSSCTADVKPKIVRPKPTREGLKVTTIGESSEPTPSKDQRVREAETNKGNVYERELYTSNKDHLAIGRPSADVMEPAYAKVHKERKTSKSGLPQRPEPPAKIKSIQVCPRTTKAGLDKPSADVELAYAKVNKDTKTTRNDLPDRPNSPAKPLHDACMTSPYNKTVSPSTTQTPRKPSNAAQAPSGPDAAFIRPVTNPVHTENYHEPCFQRRPVNDYDNVFLNSDDNAPEKIIPETINGRPPKPPRTFAYDEYMRLKAKKKAFRISKTKGHTYEEIEPKANTYEEIASPHVLVDKKRAINPGKSPKQLMKCNTYEDIDNVIADKVGTDKRTHKKTSTLKRSITNITGDKKHEVSGIGSSKHNTYERIDKLNGNTLVPDRRFSSLKRPGTRPPPPPRPPPPSCTPSSPVTRVAAHNPALGSESYIGQKRVTNPTYEKKHEFIEIKTVVTPNGKIKRYKSDECLYAEPVTKPADDDDIFIEDNPIYNYLANARSKQEPEVTAHGVTIDSEGYALPVVGKSRLGSEPRRRGALRKSGTISSREEWRADPPSPRFDPSLQYQNMPIVREKISRAYSVLRTNVGADEQVKLELRKNTDNGDSDSEVDPEEHKKRLEYITSQKVCKYAALMYASNRHRQNIQPDKMFSYCLIVGLEIVPDTNQYRLRVIFSYPDQVLDDQRQVAEYCFPDYASWRPVTRHASETFSFALTNAKGDRKYGHCRRILPPGTKNRLPEVYCVVSPLGAWNMYEQLLREVENKRKLSLAHAQDLLKVSHSKSLPDPGAEAWIRSMGADPTSKETLILKRSVDSKLENVSFERLLKVMSLDTLLKIFGSILLERRVLFVAQHLSSLTRCIHSIVSLLYPFSWQHTFIPVLPDSMIDLCMAPVPFIVGILTSSQYQLQSMPMEEVLLVDLDHDMVLRCVGDESRILPKKLEKALTTVLKDETGEPDRSSKFYVMSSLEGEEESKFYVDNMAQGKEENRRSVFYVDGVLEELEDQGFKNYMDNTPKESSSTRSEVVFEAFLRMFVETIGHYTEYIVTQQDGQPVFQRELFIKAVSSKSIRMFLEWFTETQMFEVFITDKMENPNTRGIFENRIDEYRIEMEGIPSFKQNVVEVGKKMLNFILHSGGRIKKAFTGKVFV